MVRSPLFVIGAAVPLALMVLEVVGFFWPTFPTPQLHRAHYFHFARDFPPINTKVNFYTIGFAYFANVNVLGSVCFFYLLFVLEGGACNRLGVGLGQRGDPYGSYVFAGAGWQSYGAFLVLVVWGLYVMVLLRNHATERDPNFENSPAWKHMYLMLFALQLGFAVVYYADYLMS